MRFARCAYSALGAVALCPWTGFPSRWGSTTTILERLMPSGCTPPPSFPAGRRLGALTLFSPPCVDLAHSQRRTPGVNRTAVSRFRGYRRDAYPDTLSTASHGQGKLAHRPQRTLLLVVSTRIGTYIYLPSLFQR